MLIIEENTLTHVDSVSDIIEHYGKKGMKWGVRNSSKKSYDRVGLLPGKIEKNRNKRLGEKRKNLNEIRNIKGDKSKKKRLNELRRRNHEIESINNRADARYKKSKKAMNLGRVAGTYALGYAMYRSMGGSSSVGGSYNRGPIRKPVYGFDRTI